MVPNALWHMDGYDKLKPYGIAINGCKDGFSRYVLWMEAFTTNSDPKLASYFTKTVSSIGGPGRGNRKCLCLRNADVFCGETIQTVLQERRVSLMEEAQQTSALKDGGVPFANRVHSPG